MMAKAVGISASSVQRIWRTHGLITQKTVVTRLHEAFLPAPMLMLALVDQI
jgi:hypothetical protein